MNFSIQSILKNEQVILLPLKEPDFDELYAIASDNRIWEQHPCNDRWKKDVFKTFFEGAIQSKGAFKIIEKSTGKVAGSTRFYDYNEKDNSILIGYTFYGVKFWGTGMNPSVKKLMMDYIFQYVDKVYFHVGATNYRSQIAVSRLGALKIGEENVVYPRGLSNPNFIYEVRKENYPSSFK